MPSKPTTASSAPKTAQGTAGADQLRGPSMRRTGLTAQAIRRGFEDNLLHVLGRFPAVATPVDNYTALALTVRDRLMQRWIATAETYFRGASRTVCYLSAEFLLGPHLGNNLVNLGIVEETREAMNQLSLDLDKLLETEVEPGLGNGGLGRLAACYLDSLATLEIPSIGYGIRYEFGIFEQAIHDGQQVERTDKWLNHLNPWEIQRPEVHFEVKLGGRLRESADAAGNYRVEWLPDRIVKGTAFDTPILGYRVNTANMLRLWSAEATEEFDLQAFNKGDYYGAVEDNVASENLTKVLYPNDEGMAGKQLRLEQQYFFVSCSLQDMIRIHLQRASGLSDFHEKYTVQLNDTHPSIAVAELMRLLVDEHGMGWDDAWEVTRRTFGYTNHTLLPEALEKWPVELFSRLLPRHLQIIYELNRRFLDEVRAAFPGDDARVGRLSLIDESGGRYVRMAHLACIGSRTINGVARLHSELLCRQVLGDFHALWPERFLNVTNGVTPRRFLVLANPRLAALITEAVGDDWARDLEDLGELERFAGDRAFRDRWREVTLVSKNVPARHLRRRQGLRVDPSTLFDIQVKRFHEYKRQHLNLLHVIARYLRLKREGSAGLVPRTFLFGGKAAPGYFLAKQIIHLIHRVGDVVNNDPETRDWLRVGFMPNFNVTNAQRIYPAADLSEQISTAGMEASGTGNMKFSLNGALTIGTLDGANVEIREAVGADNFFLFGLDAGQVQEWKRNGYDPSTVLQSNPRLREVLELVASGAFDGGDRSTFRPLVDSLVSRDPFLVLADFGAYLECQQAVDAAFAEPDDWARRSILNVARMARFSSDRAIREYCREIWKLDSVRIELES